MSHTLEEPAFTKSEFITASPGCPRHFRRQLVGDPCSQLVQRRRTIRPETRDVMSDIFKGKSLIKKDNKSFSADTVLRDKQLICLYFAAQWCPPCRMFTPVLANVYKDARDDNLAIEVVFISADRNKQDMLNYMRSTHGDWYALPFDDPLHG
ncbi:hypothetical protein HPB52_006745 [Rhipicephalus sanguineus]|uniref:Thioredoxin domain-containing protein n=1 Tax=Rhipicephalus sanguineus TaxID=34632 RepID=A0A9D4SMI4_RHISA|nr:hypothetical protein HPB52_006745 [Rhipicephalus sanguineus]